MDKNYNHSSVEDRVYSEWLEAGYFHAPLHSPKKPYTIIMPPPNITGELHMGHAYGDTIQDILIRFKRMQGYNALWLPGIDHASISTEVKVVDKILREEGLSKADVGRESFLERAWLWKEAYGGRILKQIRKFGCSCDWERECFTMDEGPNRAVTEVFVRLYEKGLIYRGERLINWCPHCSTTISDAEVEHQENEAYLYYIRYPINDAEGKPSEEWIQFATTRPETLFADVAIAVHPEDPRYTHIIGKTTTVPFIGRVIPIIADIAVDMEFGMGALKITPGHSMNDYEIGLRHGLPLINVLNDDATLNEENAHFAGMGRFEARERIIEEYENLGYLAKREKITNFIGVHERCKKVVEPLSKLQWFVKMDELAQPALQAYRNGELRIYPERFGKVYLHWLDGIRDWCISRQLWWGHRIPAYTCAACGHIMVERAQPENCCRCGATKPAQEEDCLDTWFSSALWPFSTLGWPEDTPQLNKFFPGDVLVTGHEILFFWVIRMVFSGLEQMGELPFRDVVLHGILRDEQGRKLSKSLGNGIDPLEIIDKFGADVMRMTLIAGNSLENDARFYPEKIEANRTFLNKIWNAARFILMNLEEGGGENTLELTVEDRWITSRLNTLAQDVTNQLERYDFSAALKATISFIRDEFCDWYIEMVKPRLYNKENATRGAAMYTLKNTMVQAMKLLHPFMPFITEEVFQALKPNEETPSIMVATWPSYKELKDAIAEKQVGLLQEAVRQVRALRLSKNLEPGRKVAIFIVAQDHAVRSVFEGWSHSLVALAGGSRVSVQAGVDGIDPDAVSAVVEGAVIYIPIGDLVDMAKERERLEAELARLSQEVSRVDRMLANPGFIAKAKPHVVDAERAKSLKYREMLAKVEQELLGKG